MISTFDTAWSPRVLPQCRSDNIKDVETLPRVNHCAQNSYSSAKNAICSSPNTKYFGTLRTGGDSVHDVASPR